MSRCLACNSRLTDIEMLHDDMCKKCLGVIREAYPDADLPVYEDDSVENLHEVDFSDEWDQDEEDR